MNQNKRVLKNVYRTYVDVMNYVKADKKSFDISDKDNNADVEMKEEHENHGKMSG